MSENTTYPKCPKCDNDSFVAINVDSVKNAENALVFITCAKSGCGYPISVLPHSAVYDE